MSRGAGTCTKSHRIADGEDWGNGVALAQGVLSFMFFEKVLTRKATLKSNLTGGLVVL